MAARRALVDRGPDVELSWPEEDNEMMPYWYLYCCQSRLSARTHRSLSGQITSVRWGVGPVSALAPFANCCTSRVTALLNRPSASAVAAVSVVEKQILPARRPDLDAANAVHELGGAEHAVGRQGEDDARILEHGEDLVHALGAARHSFIGRCRGALVPVDDVDGLRHRIDEAPIGLGAPVVEARPCPDHVQRRRATEHVVGGKDGVERRLRHLPLHERGGGEMGGDPARAG